ncbi:hypothetical protein [Microbacterium phyllosphaerae]
MRAWDQMRQVRDVLFHQGIESLIPDTDEVSPCSSSEEMNEMKRVASLRHFEYIQDAQTAAVLVVNVDKDGQNDYIGPNSFAEIAVAVAAGRRVYLMYGTPLAYSDELQAWGARELNGRLETLAAEMQYAHAS